MGLYSLGQKERLVWLYDTRNYPASYGLISHRVSNSQRDPCSDLRIDSACFGTSGPLRDPIACLNFLLACYGTLYCRPTFSRYSSHGAKSGVKESSDIDWTRQYEPSALGHWHFYPCLPFSLGFYPEFPTFGLKGACMRRLVQASLLSRRES